MNNRILVHMISLTDCIGFRTVSRSRKSPHYFYILRSRLIDLERKSEIIVHEINSFAVLRQNTYAGTIEIEFTWLSGDYSYIFGYRQTIILPYSGLKAFLQKSILERNPVTWKALSIEDSHKYPKLVFKSKKNLKDVLANGIIRRKLVRVLQNEFHWPLSEKIEFYDDYCIPYSFTFREIRNGKPAVSGGLILHGLDNMKTAHYSIHT